MSAESTQDPKQVSDRLETFLKVFGTLVGGGFLTWILGSYFTAKADQQKQLDNFVTSLSKLVIENNLYASKAAKTTPALPKQINAPANPLPLEPQTNDSEVSEDLVKPESFVAQAYVINTLQSFDSPLPFVQDNRKKQTVLKFLQGFQLLGYCDKSPSTKCFPTKIPLDGAELDGIDFRYLVKDISGINLSGVRLRKAILSGSILKKAKFKGTDLQEADFSYADLTDASFDGAYLQDADFNGAILDRANFKNTMLCGTRFSNAKYSKSASFYNAYFNSNTILPVPPPSGMRKLDCFILQSRK